MRKLCLIILVAAFVITPVWAASLNKTSNPEYAAWIAQMKNAERGPFARIRWFCKDGQILPPKPYACKDFGGGYQHGQWSERTVELRDAGYVVATFYTDLEIDKFVRDAAAHD